MMTKRQHLEMSLIGSPSPDGVGFCYSQAQHLTILSSVTLCSDGHNVTQVIGCTRITSMYSQRYNYKKNPILQRQLEEQASNFLCPDVASSWTSKFELRLIVFCIITIPLMLFLLICNLILNQHFSEVNTGNMIMIMN